MKEINEFTRNELIELFNNNFDAIKQHYNFLCLLDEGISDYIKYGEKKEQTQKRCIWIILLTLFLLTTLVILYVFLKNHFPNQQSNLLMPFITYFLYLLLIPTIYIINRVMLKKKLNNTYNCISNCIKEIEELRKKNYALQIIPFMYQTPAAISEMHTYLKNYRANNWTEAVNILEDTIHKNKLLLVQTSQNSALNEQLKLLYDIKQNTQTSGLDILTSVLGVFL